MCESTLQANKCLKSANTPTIIVVIKELFKKSSTSITLIKRSNGKRFSYHGATVSIFIKGKRDWFNICIANKTFKYVIVKGKVKHLMPEATGYFLVPLLVNYFFGMYFLQFSITQAQKGCI